MGGAPGGHLRDVLGCIVEAAMRRSVGGAELEAAELEVFESATSHKSHQRSVAFRGSLSDFYQSYVYI